ncbi:hypothetical protein SEVIR_9G300750v4 [Setaria viridis]
MAAALRVAARLAGVATRVAVRSLDRYARRWALQSVTREITLADVLLEATMTWGDDEEPAAEDASTLSVVGTAAVILAACVLLGCCSLAVDTDDDGSALYKDDRHARHVVSKRHLDPRLAAHLRHRQACNPK